MCGNGGGTLAIYSEYEMWESAGESWWRILVLNEWVGNAIFMVYLVGLSRRDICLQHFSICIPAKVAPRWPFSGLPDLLMADQWLRHEFASRPFRNLLTCHSIIVFPIFEEGGRFEVAWTIGNEAYLVICYDIYMLSRVTCINWVIYYVWTILKCTLIKKLFKIIESIVD